MGSSKKTTNLGLCSWIETDSPKRSDFVSDNLIIDNLVGNHIKDSSLHLTATEKDRISAPFDVNTYYGTGEESATMFFNYTPTMVIICKKNSPLQTVKNGSFVVNGGIATSIGVTGGITISNRKVVVEQSSETVNGVYYNLNESRSEYLIITFK